MSQIEINDIKIRMNQSNTFDDNRFTLKTWLTQMFIQFIMNELQYRNEVAKILYAFPFLEKNALKWIQSRLDDYAINPHSERKEETQQIFHHFENFVVKLKRIFENSEEETITRKKLFKLKQLSSLITYASQFQTLTYKLN